jgi:hypothetical protein
VYSDPKDQRHRDGDGTDVQLVGVVFTARVSGTPSRRVNDEITSVGLFDTTNLPEHLFGPDRPVIEDALRVGAGPFIR